MKKKILTTALAAWMALYPSIARVEEGKAPVKIDGFTYEQYIKSGWTEERMKMSEYKNKFAPFFEQKKKEPEWWEKMYTDPWWIAGEVLLIGGGIYLATQKKPEEKKEEPKKEETPTPTPTPPAPDPDANDPKQPNALTNKVIENPKNISNLEKITTMTSGFYFNPIVPISDNTYLNVQIYSNQRENYGGFKIIKRF